MAEVSFAQPASKTVTTRQDEQIGLDLFPSCSAHPTLPEPNPPFIFPMQSSPVLGVQTETEHLPSGEAAGSRRSIARGRPQHISINALPAFDFHPSSTSSTATLPHSPQSPTKSVAVPARVGGHRRGGSEFIGGDGKIGGLGLMSTSPTKGEGVLPPPQVTRLGPPNSRRGHAHRRSGAISSHDLSTIIRPKDLVPPRSGSAPTTPSDPGIDPQFLPSLDRSTSQPVVTTVEPKSEPQLHPYDGGNVSETSRPRPRVGFSDTLEFIPRPLSTISSDTSSSLSTIRASHSVTGSVTSIISSGTSSPPSAKKSHSLVETPMIHEPVNSRPKTASAVLDNSYVGFSLGPVVENMQRPSPAAASPHGITDTESSTSYPDSKDLFYNAGYISSKAGSLASSARSEFSTQISSPTAIYPSSYPATSRSRSSPEQKVAKRQRKVKSWAGSILSRRGRHRSLHERTVNRRSITPSALSLTPFEDVSLDTVTFDEDASHIVCNSQDDSPRAARIDFSTWKPRQSIPFPDSDVHSPMLDLDAALGPFNTPTKGSSDVDVTGGSSLAKRRMHSSGTTGGFAGPGMHYHRRAESAPEMAPINSHIFGLHRLGSNSTMADVFEEDEENEGACQSTDLGAEMPSSASLDDSLHGLGVQTVEVENDGKLPERRSRMIKQEESKDMDSPRLDREPLLEQSANLPTPGPIYEEIFPVEIVDAAEAPRFSVVTKSSDDSTITPRLSLDPSLHRPASAPLDFARPTLGQYFELPDTTSSAVSSPSFANTSFDVPRLNTARSSITDRTAWSSSRIGEHAHDHGYSADDVPSLTSSASTMISANPPRFSSSAGTRTSGDRSSSFTAAVPTQTRPATAGKRSSLASLSRLVGSSYGEKSKLSIESQASHDDADKPDKKKGNRISRLMRFWKSKEKLDISRSNITSTRHI